MNYQNLKWITINTYVDFVLEAIPQVLTDTPWFSFWILDSKIFQFYKLVKTGLCHIIIKNYACWWNTFNSLPQATLFVEQIFTKFDTDKNGTIDFRVSMLYPFVWWKIIRLSNYQEFMLATNLSEAEGTEAKLRMAFRLYDKDSSGVKMLWQGLIWWSRSTRWSRWSQWTRWWSFPNLRWAMVFILWAHKKHDSFGF